MKEKIINLINDEIKELYKIKSSYKNDDFMQANINARLACLQKLKNDINNLEEVK